MFADPIVMFDRRYNVVLPLGDLLRVVIGPELGLWFESKYNLQRHQVACRGPVQCLTTVRFIRDTRSFRSMKQQVHREMRCSAYIHTDEIFVKKLHECLGYEFFRLFLYMCDLYVFFGNNNILQVSGIPISSSIPPRFEQDANEWIRRCTSIPTDQQMVRIRSNETHVKAILEIEVTDHYSQLGVSEIEYICQDFLSRSRLLFPSNGPTVSSTQNDSFYLNFEKFREIKKADQQRYKSHVEEQNLFLNHLNLNPIITIDPKGKRQSTANPTFSGHKLQNQSRFIERLPRQRMMHQAYQLRTNYRLLRPVDSAADILKQIFNTNEALLQIDLHSLQSTLEPLLDRLRKRFKSNALASMLKQYLAQLETSYVTLSSVQGSNITAVPLVDLSLDHVHVCAFLRQALRHVCPDGLLDAKNCESLYRKLKYLIKKSTCSYLYYELFYEAIDVNRVSWLQTVSDDKIRRFLVAHLIRWFVRFSVQVLGENFYITTSDKRGTKLLFFPRTRWPRLRPKSVMQMPLRPISKVQTGAFWHSYRARWVAKSFTFRLVCSLFRRDKRKDPRKSLEMSKAILSLLADQLYDRPTDCESFSSALKAYIERQSLKLKVFFVRSDISTCFPSIDREQMMRIVQQLLIRVGAASKNDFEVRQVWRLHRLPGKLAQRSKYVATEYSGGVVSRSLLDQLNKGRDNVFIMTSFAMRINASTLLHMIRVYLTHTPIYDSGRWLQLNDGLIIGGSLSSILCRIYLVSLLKQEFAAIINRPDVFFFMFADDMLMMTVNKQLALDYACRWRQGNTAYGIPSGTVKLQTNFPLPEFDIEARSPSPTHQIGREFTFFGFTIDPNRRQISKDILKLDFNAIYYHLRINEHCTPDRYLNSCAVPYVAFILLDGELIGSVGMLRNIFRYFLFSALKLLVLICCSQPRLPSDESKLVVNCVFHCSKRFYLTAKRVKQRNAVRFDLLPNQIFWIALNAFYHVWNVQNSSTRHQEAKLLRQLITYLAPSMPAAYRKCDFKSFLPEQFYQLQLTKF